MVFGHKGLGSLLLSNTLTLFDVCKTRSKFRSQQCTYTIGITYIKGIIGTKGIVYIKGIKYIYGITCVKGIDIKYL